MKTTICSIRLAITLSVLFATQLEAQQNVQVSNAERFYAYSLYNFSKLIDWPNSASLTSFQIAVVGDKKVYNELIEVSKNKKIGNAVYKIEYFTSVEAMTGNFHIIYLSNIQSSNVRKLSQDASLKNVLLVTERQGMTNSGSTISFTTNNDGQLGFEIAKTNAVKNQLVIRLQLERMALRVS